MIGIDLLDILRKLKHVAMQAIFMYFSIYLGPATHIPNNTM